MKALLAMLAATALYAKIPYDNTSVNYSHIIDTTKQRYRNHDISQTDLEAVLRVMTQPLL